MYFWYIEKICINFICYTQKCIQNLEIFQQLKAIFFFFFFLPSSVCNKHFSSWFLINWFDGHVTNFFIKIKSEIDFLCLILSLIRVVDWLCVCVCVAITLFWNDHDFNLLVSCWTNWRQPCTHGKVIVNLKFNFGRYTLHWLLLFFLGDQKLFSQNNFKNERPNFISLYRKYFSKYDRPQPAVSQYKKTTKNSLPVLISVSLYFEICPRFIGFSPLF